MIESVDKYLRKPYHGTDYNCLHLVAEAWQEHTGEDIWQQLCAFHRPVGERFVRREARRHFVEIDKPKEPCIVLWQRARDVPHVGIYLRGRVLHIHEGGAEFELLKTACNGSHKTTRFYICKH